jgi:lipoyl(octanoyl) transferase
METENLERETYIGFQDWGLIEYGEAMRRQSDLVDLVHQELARDTVVFCSHPPIVTLGRGTLPGDVYAWKGPTAEVNRGGRATYHGPSQVIVYPILDLNLRLRDLHQHMRTLENVVIQTLADYGIASSGKSIQQDSADESIEATGVWVGSRKIASIGIGVRKWVSFHGLALNVDRDEKAFLGMKPCGFNAETMISMEEILGRKVDHEEVKSKLQKYLLDAQGPARLSK